VTIITGIITHYPMIVSIKKASNPGENAKVTQNITLRVSSQLSNASGYILGSKTIL